MSALASYSVYTEKKIKIALKFRWKLFQKKFDQYKDQVGHMHDNIDLFEENVSLLKEQNKHLQLNLL